MHARAHRGTKPAGLALIGLEREPTRASMPNYSQLSPEARDETGPVLAPAVSRASSKLPERIRFRLGSPQPGRGAGAIAIGAGTGASTAAGGGNLSVTTAQGQF